MMVTTELNLSIALPPDCGTIVLHALGSMAPTPVRVPSLRLSLLKLDKEKTFLSLLYISAERSAATSPPLAKAPSDDNIGGGDTC